MKILKFNEIEIGPFQVVEQTTDGYMCDGALFPTPVFGDYKVVEVSDDYLSAGQKATLNQNAKVERALAYKEESDPLFFKWQRDELTKEEWLAKVEEIKERYPYVV